jgi:hypothetical protein
MLASAGLFILWGTKSVRGFDIKANRQGWNPADHRNCSLAHREVRQPQIRGGDEAPRSSRGQALQPTYSTAALVRYVDRPLVGGQAGFHQSLGQRRMNRHQMAQILRRAVELQ